MGRTCPKAAILRLAQSASDVAGQPLRFPILADGSLGAPAVWVDTDLKQPVGLKVGCAGGLFTCAANQRMTLRPTG